MENKILGPAFGYAAALDHLTSEHIKKQREDGTEFQKTPIRPSAAGHCERELAYALMEFRGLAKYDKPLNSPELHRVFGLGHSIEYHLLREMETQFKNLFSVKYKQQSLSFLYLESQVDSKFSQWVEGSTDFVLWSEKHRAIGDVKSKKAKFSSYRDSDWEETNDKFERLATMQKIDEACYYIDDLPAFLREYPDPFLRANFLQLNLYALNPFIAERGIDHAFLIFYNKATSELRELRFRPSKELYDYVLQKFSNAFSAVEKIDPEMAKKEFALGSMKCAFCSYRETCWPESDPLKTYFKTLPPKRWPRDTNRLPEDLAEAIENAYEAYKSAAAAASNMTLTEEELTNLLVDNKLDKIRFADGEIYEVRLYKSPREHFKLKRSKM